MSKKFNCWLVGGACRDMLLGVKSKDNDYVCECSFEALREKLLEQGLTILHEKPEFLTMRVRKADGEVVDFACCRSEMDYDGRRPGSVLETNLLTDLARRDFTVNAMAMAVDENFVPTGEIIDPYGGQNDLKTRTLKFVGDPHERLKEDGLRWLRALRFVITKDFHFDLATEVAVMYITYNPLKEVSVERVREELYRCFKHDTSVTLAYLHILPSYWMKDGLWLVPTLEER